MTRPRPRPREPHPHPHRYVWVLAVLVICGSTALIQHSWLLLAAVAAVPVLGVGGAALISRIINHRRPPT